MKSSAEKHLKRRMRKHNSMKQDVYIEPPEFAAEIWFRSMKHLFEDGRIPYSSIPGIMGYEVMMSSHKLITAGIISEGKLIAGVRTQAFYFKGVEDKHFRILYIFVEEKHRGHHLGKLLTSIVFNSFCQYYPGEPFYWGSNLDGDSAPMRRILSLFGLEERNVLNAVGQKYMCRRVGETISDWNTLDQSFARRIVSFLKEKKIENSKLGILAN